MPYRFALIFAFLTPFATGCFAEPEVGEPIAGVCDPEDSNPDRDVSFSADILGLFFGQGEGERRCRCHDPRDPNPTGFFETGLDLTTYDTLRNGGVRSGTNIVIPSNACDSVLYQKVTAPPFGSLMPQSGPPLNTAQRDLIHDWIIEGALDN